VFVILCLDYLKDFSICDFVRQLNVYRAWQFDRSFGLSKTFCHCFNVISTIL